MNCIYCEYSDTSGKGWTPSGRQRFECPNCEKSFSIVPELPLDEFGDYLATVAQEAGIVAVPQRPYTLDALLQFALAANLRLSELLIKYEQKFYLDTPQRPYTTQDVAQRYGSSRRAIGARAKRLGVGEKVRGRLFFSEGEVAQLAPQQKYKQNQDDAVEFGGG